MHQATLLHNKHKICQITHVFKIPFTNKLFSQKNSVDSVKKYNTLIYYVVYKTYLINHR